MTWEMLEDILGGLSPSTDALWFFGYWGLLALLAGLEFALPAFQQPPQRDKRWPTNLGLGDGRFSPDFDSLTTTSQRGMVWE